ncbi:MAG TPA: uroporphyrinogen-III synthase [Gemmatimonadales bacterium]
MSEVIVVTAAAGSLPGLIAALTAIPLAVEEYPLMGFAEPKDWDPVDRALTSASKYRAVAFTSPRASSAIVQRLRSRGIAWPSGGSAPVVWAGGSATAAALKQSLGPVRTPPAEATARLGAAGALAQAMLGAGTGSPVLFLCGESRREELTVQLTGQGLEVDEAVCYRSILATPAEGLAAATRATVLVVTSPRVAELLGRACPAGRRPDLVAVGPTTASSARDQGWPPAAVAASPTVHAIVTAVQSAVAQRCA